jgi:uncharacterized SAM-binding protein YcdF (DUF218 family)
VYFTLKSLARELLLPPAGPLLLAVLGALLIWLRRSGGWLLLVAGLACVWLLSTPVVADLLSAQAEKYPAFDPDRPTDAQAIVVIGGGGERLMAPEYAGPSADPVLFERLAYGAYLANRLSLPVLLSGAPQESVAMHATLLRNFGVTPRWVEDQSRDTYQNARFSAQLVRSAGIQRIILVTSSTHEWRAVHEFMDAGFEVTPAPEGMLAQRDLGVFRFLPGPVALWRSHTAVYELLGEQARRIQASLHIRERLHLGQH